jgi:conjugal transfer pilus assembly protein TrbC
LEEKKLLPAMIFCLCYFLPLSATDDAATDVEFAKKLASAEPSKDGVEFAEKALKKSKLDLVRAAEALMLSVRASPYADCNCSNRVESSKSDDCRPRGTTPLNGSNGTLVVFVSFSMPKASLKELSDQRQKYGATLVLRGLHEGSFSKTKDKILEISQDGLQLDINPELFREYDVHQVPTFVLIKGGKEVNRLLGNVTLEFAHQKLLEEE